MTESDIAIIDDNPDSFDLLKYAILTSFPKAKVSIHKSGDALLSSIPHNEPDAVVTRQKLLGHLDGLSLVRHLRERGFWGPIVMITNSEELEADALEAGVSSFLTFDRWADLPSRLACLISNA